MQANAIEEHSANLVSGYLAARRDEIGLPADDVLQFITPYSIADIAGHRLCFPQAQVEWKSPRNAVVGLTMELQTVAYGEGRVVPATDAQWCAAIRRAVLDAAAWQQYLASLNDAARTGWKLLARPVVRNGGVDLLTDESLRIRSTELLLNFLVD